MRIRRKLLFSKTGFIVPVYRTPIPELRRLTALPSERNMVALAGGALESLRHVKNYAAVSTPGAYVEVFVVCVF